MDLSPLAQGNREGGADRGDIPGPIPARAGEPVKRSIHCARVRAYPRSRRGTYLPEVAASVDSGLSPLEQGNRRAGESLNHLVGPIPARAGEPRPTESAPRSERAYPRSRRGTCADDFCGSQMRGLSPLAQGNLPLLLARQRLAGPIPVRAGEPICRGVPLHPTRAYPRSRRGTDRTEHGYGGDPAYPRSSRGTRFTGREHISVKGLSPLAQGNHKLDQRVDVHAGPIPARAGEPRRNPRRWPGRRAYPRSRRGTGAVSVMNTSWPGLSPLAQGNPEERAALAEGKGPIPARAGEPQGRAANDSAHWAYPRSRRGTWLGSCHTGCSSGLSPLAQGNHSAGRFRLSRLGPIPARAGEPQADKRPANPGRAYPRSRRGTRRNRARDLQIWGLSPLAQGNRTEFPWRPGLGGPIPARAGEPACGVRCNSAARAYPRSRRGTGVVNRGPMKE